MQLFMLVAATLIARATAAPADPSKTSSATPCTATSASGSFFDLNPDSAIAPAEKRASKHGPPTTDYIARGHDYGTNFTINVCAPVVSKIGDIVGVKKQLWRNVSAYYTMDNEIYSLGMTSKALLVRGKKLVLQYSGGSPCAQKKKKHHSAKKQSRSLAPGASATAKNGKQALEGGGSLGLTSVPIDGDDDDDDDDTYDGRRKSMVISFLCDRDPMSERAAISFVGTDPDECAYFFEARSKHACATVEKHQAGSVGPGSVFAIILAIAVLVYVVGGVFYQRTVAHARGWRQLPNYSLWAGIWSFISDYSIIVTSSCLRLLPNRRGYNSLSGASSRRHRNREAENRLIDQLDEEWED